MPNRMCVLMGKGKTGYFRGKERSFELKKKKKQKTKQTHSVNPVRVQAGDVGVSGCETA